MKQNKKSILCKDNSSECKKLVKKGLCKKDPNIANNLCRKSCNACEPNNVKYFLDHINTNAKKCRIDQLGKVYGEIEDEDIIRSDKYKNLMNSNGITLEGEYLDVLRKRLKKLEKIRLLNLEGLDCEYDKESKKFNDERYKKYLVHQKKNEYRQDILSDKYHKNLLLRDLRSDPKKVVIDLQCPTDSTTPVVNKIDEDTSTDVIDNEENDTSNVISNNLVSDNLIENDETNNKKSVKQSVIDLNNKVYINEKEEENNIYDNYNIDLSLFDQLEEEEEEEEQEQEEQNVINEEDETIDEETYFQVDNKVSKRTYVDYRKQLKIIDNLKYKKPYNYYIIGKEIGLQGDIDEEIVNEESAFYNSNIIDKKVNTVKEIIDEEYGNINILDEKNKIIDEEYNNINILDEKNKIMDEELNKLKDEDLKKEFEFSNLDNNIYAETEEEILIDDDDDDNTIGFTYKKLWYIFILFVFIFIIYKLFIKKRDLSK